MPMSYWLARVTFILFMGFAGGSIVYGFFALYEAVTGGPLSAEAAAFIGAAASAIPAWRASGETR